MHGCGNSLAAIGLLLVSWQLAPSVRAAIVLGQVDDFEDGTLHDWSNGGATNPNPATNVASGGPGGAADNFMLVSANGQLGAGGKLVVFNSLQWAGNYLAAGVDGISMQARNQGSTDLTLRLILSGGAGSLSTVAPVELPAGGGWTTVSFPLASANLAGDSVNDVLAGVSELNLVHSPSVITSRAAAPGIEAQLGVDNITAGPVPEPGGGLGLAGVVAAMWLARRRRS